MCVTNRVWRHSAGVKPHLLRKLQAALPYNLMYCCRLNELTHRTVSHLVEVTILRVKVKISTVYKYLQPCDLDQLPSLSVQHVWDLIVIESAWRARYEKPRHSWKTETASLEKERGVWHWAVELWEWAAAWHLKETAGHLRWRFLSAALTQWIMMHLNFQTGLAEWSPGKTDKDF